VVPGVDAAALLAAVLAGASDAVVGTALDGTVVSWNAAAERLFGYAAAEVVGAPGDPTVPADRRAEHAAVLARVAAGETVAGEAVRVARDGRRLALRLTCAPARGAGGVVGAATLLARGRARLPNGRRGARVGGARVGGAPGARAGRGRGRLLGLGRRDRREPARHALVRHPRLRARRARRPRRHVGRAAPPRRPRARVGGGRGALRRRDPQYEVETRLRHRDGRWVWVHARGKVVARAAAGRRPGRPLRVVGTIADVSARKAAELALREREADQQFLAELAAALQSTTDPEALGAVGLARLAGHFGAPVCRRTTHDAARGEFTVEQECRGGTAARHGRTLALAAWPAECLARLRAGETVAVADAAADPRTAPYPAAAAAVFGGAAALATPVLRDGALAGVISLADDAPREWSERDAALFRAAAERLWSALEVALALRAADLERRRLQAVLDALPVGVLVADAAGEVVHYSDRLARIMRADAGTPPVPEAWGLARALRQGATSAGQLVEVERGDAGRVTVLSSAGPVRDAGGRVVGAVAVVTDVTEQRRTDERVRQAQKLEAVGQLAGGVAHDFNNLLTVISGNLELARDTVPAGHPAHVELGEIGRAAERARTLVRQLLAFSRKQQVRPRPVQVGALVARSECLLARVVGDDVELSVRVADGAATVLADPAQLEQVLVNLAANARDAMRTPAHGHPGSGGTLAVEVDVAALGPDEAPAWDEVPPGRYVRLVVRDTGHGMDAATRARAFEPFFTTKPVGAGAGLGLATAHGIVRQAGGAIRVDSAPGRGAAITILLPADGRAAAADERAAAADGANGAGAADAPAPRRTVLLAEDESAVRAVARRILERRGFAVREARNGRDALRLWRAHRAEVVAVVTDVRLPELGGRELADALRADEPRVPVVFVSGYSDEGAGASRGPHEAFVPKPFTAASLSAALDRVLADAAAGAAAPGGAAGA
jgi:PAS domain S-box-containing protein